MDFKITANDLAKMLNGKVEGDPSTVVVRPSRIEEATPKTITFLANPKYEHYVYSTEASIVLVSQTFQPTKPISTTLLRVDNVYESIALLLEKFGANQEFPKEISALASIADSAKIGEGVFVGDFAVIGPNVTIGAGTEVHAQVYIGRNCKIGDNCRLFPGVKIYYDCLLGHRVTIHANTVVGSDGFGFAKTDEGFRKIKQVGNVVIEDDVEIGANTVIDRAAMDSTVIGSGVKVDNLVQVAHNVEIGSHTVIAAQAGIAGSSKIGNHVMIGGQAGIVGHLKIGDGTEIQAQSGVTNSTRAQDKVYGSPALSYNNYLRSYATFRRLPKLDTTVHKLEQQVADLEKQLNQLKSST